MKERRKFYYTLLFLFIFGSVFAWLGFYYCKTKHEKELQELNVKVDGLICQRDSLLLVYYKGDKALQATLDSLKIVNAERRFLIALYNEKMNDSLPANAKELEKEIYRLLKLIRGEVLPE